MRSKTWRSRVSSGAYSVVHGRPKLSPTLYYEGCQLLVIESHSACAGCLIGDGHLVGQFVAAKSHRVFRELTQIVFQRLRGVALETLV